LTDSELRRTGARSAVTPYYSMTYRYNWISNVVAPANRTFIWGLLFDLGLFSLFCAIWAITLFTLFD